MGKGRDADRQQVQVQGTSLSLTSTYFFSFTLYTSLENTENVIINYSSWQKFSQLLFGTADI